MGVPVDGEDELHVSGLHEHRHGVDPEHVEVLRLNTSHRKGRILPDAFFYGIQQYNSEKVIVIFNIQIGTGVYIVNFDYSPPPTFVFDAIFIFSSYPF